MMIFADRLARREGNSIAMMVAIQFAIADGKTIIVSTNDQAGTLRRLQYYLPRAWFVIENGWIRIISK